MMFVIFGLIFDARNRKQSRNIIGEVNNKKRSRKKNDALK